MVLDGAKQGLAGIADRRATNTSGVTFHPVQHIADLRHAMRPAGLRDAGAAAIEHGKHNVQARLLDHCRDTGPGPAGRCW
jgi:hypothetical protein